MVLKILIFFNLFLTDFDCVKVGVSLRKVNDQKVENLKS